MRFAAQALGFNWKAKSKTHNKAHNKGKATKDPAASPQQRRLGGEEVQGIAGRSGLRPHWCGTGDSLH